MAGNMRDLLRPRLLAVVLVGATMATTAWLLAEGAGTRQLGTRLEGPLAPRGLIDLTLAESPERSESILCSWEQRGVQNVALQVLARDERYIWKYTGALIALAAVSCLLLGPGWRSRVAVFTPLALAFVVAGLADARENAQLARLVGEHPLTAEALIDPVRTVRTAAQVKFVALLAGAIGLLAVVGAAFRHLWVGQVSCASDVRAGERRWLSDLQAEESRGLDLEGSGSSSPLAATTRGPSGEPWIDFAPTDRVGLALSGGGIRSATFNLGLLQGLHQLRLLGVIDYLSTVSGGGYIGGFWSAWLARQVPRTDPGAASPSFPGPRQCQPPPPETAEAEEIRHVREFSRFLVPRVGFLDAETWYALVAVLGGLVPAVLASLSLIGLAFVVWLSLTFYLACPDPWAGTAVVIGLTTTVFVAFEVWWMSDGRSLGRSLGPAAEGRWWAGPAANAAFSAVAVVAAAAVQYRIESVWAALLGSPWPRLGPGGWNPIETGGRYAGWWAAVGASAPAGPVACPRLFDVAVTLAVVATAALLVRPALLVVVRRRSGLFLAAYDRMLMRAVGLMALWAAFATLWTLGANLWRIEYARVAAGVGAVGSSTVFALLRNWIGTAFRRPERPSARSRSKTFLPQILAYATLVFVSVWIVGTLLEVLRDDWLRWWIATFAMAVCGVLVLFLDPDRFGLHAFYRDRVSRAYLGASNPDARTAADNRQADVRSRDDVFLQELEGRPLQLVCCAANDLAADTVASLSRGSRSAVLSKHGIGIGDAWRPLTGVRLSSALTASAAAFNSNMGTTSMRLGPAVTFLMCALNLRLGLWLPHPASSASPIRRLPGVLFYKEMFRRTVTGTMRATDTGSAPREVHLSDGGHFDNLALYELVRRHCRYVVVSDCTADPEVAFDDFGNAVRRIREDFGVDIEIDLLPLRPDSTGVARQHVVVGTIHYDRRFDKGILVYVKPTITGDEPPDVSQYRARNRAFPHESTFDQFYDEAQWESYRKLGVHTAMAGFRFVEEIRTPGADLFAHHVFTRARQEWFPTPPWLSDRVVEMTARFGELESDLRAHGDLGVAAEIFPELGAPARAAAMGDVEAQIPALTCLMRVIQLMEDTWLACDLDTLWNHPLNMGWINLFARWCTAPTFRTWWPLLAPMFGSDFQQFMCQRFPHLDWRAGPGTARRAHCEISKDDVPDGLARRWFVERMGGSLALRGDQMAYSYSVPLPAPGGATQWVQAGFAVVTVSNAGAGGSLVAQWTPAEFFVPPSLWGARIGTQFLDNLLAVLGRRGFGECKVTITPDATRSDPGFRAEQLGMIEFYRGAGFKVIRQNADAVVLMRVCPRAAATPPAPAAPAAGARIS